MSGLVRAALCLAVAGGASRAEAQPTGELTDPVDILRRADEAVKAVTSVRYDVDYRGLGAVREQVPTATGSVVMSGWAFNMPDKFRCEGQVRRVGSGDRVKLTVGTDGQTYFLLDHRLKRGYVGTGPAVSGSTGRAVEHLIMKEFVYPTPFSDEINGRDHKLLGTKTVGGEACYEVAVTYSGINQEAVWCFSKKDLLPRSVQRSRLMLTGKKGTEEWVLTNLVVGPEVEDDTYAFKLPTGYRRIEGFAP
ncbi:MAG: DUF2092 domain-containing protein [Phycisphaerae bacterium]|jgi:hypothetical protein